MPKKSTTARGGTQRNRPRAQKSFEVVRQTASEEQEIVADDRTEEAAIGDYSTTPTPSEEPVKAGRTEEATRESYSTMPKPSTEPARSSRKAATRTQVAASEVVEVEAEKESPVITSAPKGSTSARLAARRQGQRSQQRGAATLITPEHYTYVKRDLAIIAVLASFMFIAIIILYFVLGRGI